MSQLHTNVNGSAVTSQEMTVAAVEAPAARPVWTLVYVDAVPGIWPRLEPMLRRSVQWSTTTQKIEGIDDILAKILAHDYELWICTDGGHLLAVLVTQIAEHSLCRIVNIHYGAGEQMERWLQVFADDITEKARKLGCRFIRIEGRDGWIKPLKEIGFQKVSTTFMLEL